MKLLPLITVCLESISSLTFMPDISKFPLMVVCFISKEPLNRTPFKDNPLRNIACFKVTDSWKVDSLFIKGEKESRSEDTKQIMAFAGLSWDTGK